MQLKKTSSSVDAAVCLFKVRAAHTNLHQSIYSQEWQDEEVVLSLLLFILTV